MSKKNGQGVGVPEGYETTDAGLLPSDWTLRPLGELTRFKTGPFGSTLHQEDYVEDGIPLINPMHIYDGKLIPERSTSVSNATAKRLADFQLDPYDIVIGRRGEMGRCAVVRPQHSGWLCGTGSMIIRRSTQVEPDYLQRVLSTKRVVRDIEEASVGSTMVNLNQGVLARIQIQLPPLPEQRAIATALSDTDDLIESLERLIAKKQRIKEGAMGALLSGDRRLEGFEGEWVVRKLTDVAELHRSNIVPASQPDQYFVHYSLPSFDEGKTPVTERGRKIGSNKFIVPSGAVLVSKLNPRIPRIWAPALISMNSIGSTEWIVLTPKAGIDRTFLFVVCTSKAFGQQMEMSVTGTTGSHQRVNPITAMETTLSLPTDTQEQIAIATLLTDMDREIEALEEKLAKVRRVKEGMMGELLGGRVRLV